jgi:hypothetical protein
MPSPICCRIAENKSRLLLIALLILVGIVAFELLLLSRNDNLSEQENINQNYSKVLQKDIADKSKREIVLSKFIEEISSGGIGEGTFFSGEVVGVDNSIISLLVDLPDDTPLILTDVDISSVSNIYFADKGKYGLPENWEETNGEIMSFVKAGDYVMLTGLSVGNEENFLFKAGKVFKSR